MRAILATGTEKALSRMFLGSADPPTELHLVATGAEIEEGLEVGTLTICLMLVEIDQIVGRPLNKAMVRSGTLVTGSGRDH